jgi:hypothetical protein
MSARDLASMIERYLEADDASNGGDGGSSSNGATTYSSSSDSGLRQQVQQLQIDNASLKKDLSAIKNNLQMSALLPLLMNQSLSVVSDANGTLHPNDVIEFKQSDPLSALLPMMLMGGLGDSGDSSSDGGNNSMLLALAVAGVL